MHNSELTSALKEMSFQILFSHRITVVREKMVPVRVLRPALFDELVRRHGPGVIHLADLSGAAVLMRQVADLYIEQRLCEGCDFEELSSNSKTPPHEARAMRLLKSFMGDLALRPLVFETEVIPQQNEVPENPKSEETPVNTSFLKTVALTPAESTDPPKGAHLLAKQKDIDEMLRVIRMNKKEGSPKPYLDLLQKQPWRMLKRAQRKHLKVLEGLQRDFPNFAEVIDHLTTDLHLQIRLKAPMCFSPLLLLGPPGVGKTAFVREFATRIGFVYEEQSIASMTSSFVLAGSHASWGSADIGLVARRTLELKDNQGIVFLLDELDKLQETGRNHPLTPVLLSLLEKRQAEHFQDEYLDVRLNIAPLFTWIATANDPRTIPSHLQSRLQIKQIREPTTAEMPAVLRSIDRSLRAQDSSWSKAFSPLEADTFNAMESLVPREACSVLRVAYAKALRESSRGRGKVIVRPGHVEQAIAERWKSEPPKTQPLAEDGVMAMTVVFPISGNNQGGSTPPATVH